MSPRARLRGATRRPGLALLASIRLIPLALAALAIPAAAAPKHKPAATVAYVTKAGDTLYAIAARYLTDPRGWAVLSRLNHVPAPRRLQAGIELRLPLALLKQEPLSASVAALSGPVEHAFGAGPYTPLSIDSILGEGDRVRTGHSGFVTLELADGTHLSLPQDSSIELATLRQTTLTGTTDREINLRRGEVDSEVTHAKKPDDRFQIHSPSVVAGVRGTRFRVNYDLAGQVSAVEVLEGTVDVDAADATTTSDSAVEGALQTPSEQRVHAHFGSVTRAQGEVGAPVELLPAPALIHPEKIQDEAEVGFDLAPLDQATAQTATQTATQAPAQTQAYRVQIARDAGLLDLVRETHVGAPHASFGDLPDGTYFVRISAIDNQGLEGLSRIYAFERRQFGLAATAGPSAAGRAYEFRWLAGQRGIETHFRFVLASTPDLSNPIVDQVDITAAKVLVSDLPRGVYYWTVIGEQFDQGKLYQKAGAVRSFTRDY